MFFVSKCKLIKNFKSEQVQPLKLQLQFPFYYILPLYKVSHYIIRIISLVSYII